MGLSFSFADTRVQRPASSVAQPRFERFANDNLVNNGAEPHDLLPPIIRSRVNHRRRSATFWQTFTSCVSYSLCLPKCAGRSYCNRKRVAAPSQMLVPRDFSVCDFLVGCVGEDYNRCDSSRLEHNGLETRRLSCRKSVVRDGPAIV